MKIKTKFLRWWKYRVRFEWSWRWHRVNYVWGDFWEGFSIDVDYWIFGIEPKWEKGDCTQWWMGGLYL